MPSKVEWEPDRFLGKLRETMERAVALMGEEVINQAMPEIPVDTGTLRRSHTVTLYELPDPSPIYEQAKAGRSFNAETPEASRVPRLRDVVGYVSGNTPYALMWHERTDWTPGPRNPDARPKWLETAMRKVAPRAEAFVALARKRVFGK